MGETSAMEAAIDLHFVNVNTYYDQSGALVRFDVVGKVEADYEETQSSFDLYPLVFPRDGQMDELHAIRDATGADIIHSVRTVGRPLRRRLHHQERQRGLRP